MTSDMSYSDYFSVIPAYTDELLDQAFAVRYQVYCVEHSFESPDKQVGEREVDSYDSHSVHAVLIFKATGEVVGCVRLILPYSLHGSVDLPIRSLLDGDALRRLDRHPLERTGEISRYAVSKAFRRRRGETLYPDIGFFDTPENSRRLLPHISLGLMQGVIMLSEDQGITHVCAAIAPALLRLLSSFGIKFELLGALIEYHGLRQPCVADCESLLAGMAAKNMPYYTIVTNGSHKGTRAVNSGRFQS